jgi:hypothetical protein
MPERFELAELEPPNEVDDTSAPLLAADRDERPPPAAPPEPPQPPTASAPKPATDVIQNLTRIKPSKPRSGSRRHAEAVR